MDQPIACTLTADAFADRTAELAALAGRALLDRAPIPGGERLTFAGDPATERDLHAAVDAERSCCAFLEFDLRRSRDRLVLDVTGPVDAQPLLAELFSRRQAASGSGTTSSSRMRSSAPAESEK